MLLLSFAATNHQSLRDRNELSLIKPSLKTLHPKPPLRWRDVVEPVAAILGPNASGKTTLLRALNFAQAAIAMSARGWLEQPQMVRDPHRLDSSSLHAPSTYELDIVIANIRYFYEFSLDADGIQHELLQTLSSRQWRTLIHRERGSTVRPKQVTKEVGPVADRELILSRALVLGKTPLAEIAQAITTHLDFYVFTEFERSQRIHEISDALANNEASIEDVVSLLRIADVGVAQVDLTEEEMPSRQRDMIRAMKSVLDEDMGEGVAGEDDHEFITRSLQFTHVSQHGDEGIEPFNIHDESSGTIAWLALTMGAINVLRHGGVYCVDELDASLHSHLVETFISLFLSPEINIGHGQLLFTSHNTNILSPMSRVELAKTQVWFTEKHVDGSSELFSLADFSEGSDANHEKRYLEGRYGAVPALAPTEIARIVQTSHTESVA